MRPALVEESDQRRSCRLEPGSNLRAGEWTSDRGWQEVPEGPLHIPKSLPQIHPGSLEKVGGRVQKFCFTGC